MLFSTNELNKITGKEDVSIPVKKRNVSYEELFHLNRTAEITGKYSDFTEEKYPYGVVFYDFEVFNYDWLVVLIDPVHKLKTIICNNRAALREYYELHKEMVWIGYNNKSYDSSILKGILLGHDPKEISDKLIYEGKRGFELQEYELNKIKLYSYDVMAKKVPPESLKLLEAYMGDDIEETEVDFNLTRPLTNKEIYKTIKYCTHDVEETIEVFRYRIDDFNTQIGIINTFGFPMSYIGKTKGQLTAMVTDCHKQEHNDEFDITILPCINLGKYEFVKEWFVEMCRQRDYSKPLDPKEFPDIVKHGKQVVKKNNGKETCSFEIIAGGVPTTIAWGGLHGADDCPVHIDLTKK